MIMSIPPHVRVVIEVSTFKSFPCFLQYDLTQGWITYILALFSMCLVKYIILNMDIYILLISAKMCKCACQKANVTEGIRRPDGRPRDIRR